MKSETTCCYQCPKHQLGCRTNCEAWAAHEAAKLERYRQQDARRQETPKMTRKEINERVRLRKWKYKGSIE